MVRSDAVRRILADMQSSFMADMPSSPRFFEPNDLFGLALDEFKGFQIYDVGAGQGHVSDYLRRRGHSVTGIDVRMSETEFPITCGNGSTFNYEKDSVVMLCRPCHGDFVESVVERAILRDARAIVYVGLSKNTCDDLGFYCEQFERADFPSVGTAGENIWILRRRGRVKR